MLKRLFNPQGKAETLSHGAYFLNREVRIVNPNRQVKQD